MNNPPKKKVVIRRYRASRYLEILPQLKRLWVTSNFSCGKILVPAIPEFLESLLRFKEIKGRSGTKPGTLLKHQIPVRIFTPWDEETPGFLEIDLVTHCGESLVDTYINTLDSVDIATTWTEKQALMGKSERVTIEAYEIMEKRFPFRILGVDSDNGSEFINWHFLRMAQRKHITFTRSRAYRKNDQAHIEQKNFSTVRKIIGYRRLETEKQLVVLNRIYDKPKTPYQRVLEHPDIDGDIKVKLKSKSLTLNPLGLLKEINKLGKQLAKG